MERTCRNRCKQPKRTRGQETHQTDFTLSPLGWQKGSMESYGTFIRFISYLFVVSYFWCTRVFHHVLTKDTNKPDNVEVRCDAESRRNRGSEIIKTFTTPGKTLDIQYDSTSTGVRTYLGLGSKCTIWNSTRFTVT